MSSFGGLILTNKGKTLQSKAQTGVQLNFTRIGVGDGNLGSQSILALNDLINEVKSLNISKLKFIGGKRSVVGGTLSNQEITTGFYFREIGVFAEDPDAGEILYCYGNAGELAEYIPPGGEDVIEKTIDVDMFVGNAENVTASIDESLVFATVQQVEDITLAVNENSNSLSSHKAQDQINAHLAKNIGLEDANDNFTSTDVESALSELFTDVSNGKVSVRDAITGKDGTVTDNDGDGVPTFTELVTGVNSIPQAKGNALASDVLTGHTFSSENAGIEVSGTMPNKGSISVTPGATNKSYSSGYYSGISVQGDTDLVSENIKSGKNIFGVNGSFSGGAKSIQKGIFTKPNATGKTITISSVDPNKSILIAGNIYTHSTGVSDNGIIQTLPTLVNSNTISFSWYNPFVNTNRGYKQSWEVVEFEDASVQRGTIDLTPTARPTILNVPISPVDTNKSIVFINLAKRFTDSGTTNTLADTTFIANLTSSTNLRIETDLVVGRQIMKLNWQILSF